MWEKRADVTTFEYSNDKYKDETLKLLEKKSTKGYTNEDIVKIETKKDSIALKIIETKLYQKGDNSNIDKLTFNTDPTQNKQYDINAEKHYILYLNKMIDPQVKSLPEAKGLTTADYQAFLEKYWIIELRSKHTITINKEVLSTVK
jgi:hypothetical protein